MFVLSSCQEPKILPTDPTEARIQVEIGYDGTASGYLSTAPDAPISPVEIAESVLNEMVTASDIGVEEAESSVGPFARFRIADAYELGEAPELVVTLGPAALEPLRRNGIERVRFTCVVPNVPNQIESTAEPTRLTKFMWEWWTDTSGTEPTVITAGLQPDSGPFFQSMVILMVGVLGLGCGAIVLIRDRTARWRVGFAAGAGVCGLVALVGLTTLAAAPNAESLGVLGQLSGDAVAWIKWMPALLIVLAPLDLGVALWAVWTRHQQIRSDGEQPAPPPSIVSPRLPAS